MPMRSNRLAIAAVLNAAAVLAQPAAPHPADEKPASIAGEVRDSVTGAPIARAHVVARRNIGNQVESYAALTADDGTFVISKIPVGSVTSPFDVQMDRTGYVDTRSQTSKSTRLGPGEQKTGIKLKLTPTGAITGRVMDSTGAPAEGVSVSAVTGILPERPVRSATTDDRGVFRIGGLAPGKYRVLARKQTLPFPPEIRTDGTAELHHSPTYHPGELDAKNASRVEVGPAADVTGVDIRLVRTPIVRVSGKVSGLSDGVQNVNVQLTRPGGGFGNGTQVRPDGGFELWRVDPGKYTVYAQHFNNGEMWRSAPVEIEVGENDLDNVSLQLMAAIELHGTTIFEDEEARKGPQPPPSASQASATQQSARPPQRRYVQLRDWGMANNMGGPGAPMAEDGSFSMPRVAPGRYRVTVMPPQTYVKSVEYGQAHFDGGELDIRSGANAPVTLHIATAAGTVSGTVRDDQGPIAGVRVMLMEAGRQPMPKTVQSGADGSYNFDHVAPGTYRLLAADEADFSPSGSDEDLEGVAENVEVADRQSVVKDLKKYVPPGRR
jgi:Carboxypeptidase regulatory-like domain